MKKIFLIIAASASCTLAMAQQGVHIGVIGGPQATWLLNKNDSDDPSVKYKNGFKGYFGATVDYHFIDKLGVGVELLYSFQGQKYSDGSVVLKRDVNYFKLPVLLNFNTSPEHVVMLVGKVGPEFSFLTHASQSQGGGTIPLTNIDVRSSYTKVNVGAVFGLGLGINIKKIVILSGGIRLDAGLTDAVASDPNKVYFSYYDPSAPGNVGTSRAKTWNVAGGLEFGLTFNIPTK